jgi:hypothetical protein
LRPDDFALHPDSVVDRDPHMIAGVAGDDVPPVEVAHLVPAHSVASIGIFVGNELQGILP